MAARSGTRGAHRWLLDTDGHPPRGQGARRGARRNGPGLTLVSRAVVAVVGRPNVGKSTLFNRIVGERVAIVEDLPGTTRDRIYATAEWRGREFSLIDTGGLDDPKAGEMEAAVRRQAEAAIAESDVVMFVVDAQSGILPVEHDVADQLRRRGRIEQGIEHYALLRTAHALERSDVAILLTDGTEGITAQDTHIAGYALEAAVGLVLAVNKWDVVDRGEEMTAHALAEIVREFHFAPWMRHHFVSAKTGRNVEATLEDALAIVDERKKRVPTSELHKMLTEAIAAHPPAPYRGREVRFRHVTQARGKAPTFVFFVDPPEGVHFTFARYLENKIRERFGFPGTPIKLEFKASFE